MKNLIIDFTKPYQIRGFTESGYGNIVYILAFCLYNVKNQNIPIFVNINKDKSFKTYRDTILAIINLNFNDFKISILNHSILSDCFIVDDFSYFNDNSLNNYIKHKV